MKMTLRTLALMLLLACQVEARHAKRPRHRDVHPQKSIQFTVTTTNRRTKEVKEYLSVRIDRSKDIDICVNADEEMVEWLLTRCRSLTDHALDVFAEEFAEGFYKLPVEKWSGLLDHLRVVPGHPDKRTTGEVSGKGHHGRRKGNGKKSADRQKAKGEPEKTTAGTVNLQDLADSFLGKGVVKETDIKQAIDGFLKSGVLQQLGAGAGAQRKNDRPGEKRKRPSVEHED